MFGVPTTSKYPGYCSLALLTPVDAFIGIIHYNLLNYTQKNEKVCPIACEYH